MQESEPYNNLRRLTDLALPESAFPSALPHLLAAQRFGAGKTFIFFHSICFTSNLLWNCQTFQDLRVNILSSISEEL